METLSFGEIFVAIQAVAIYTTMRLIVYGREYFSSDSSLLDTMGVSFMTIIPLGVVRWTAANLCSPVPETLRALSRALAGPVYARPRREPRIGPL